MTKERRMTLGFEKGDKCNRDGCTGIIEEYERDVCSCHITPPAHHAPHQGGIVLNVDGTKVKDKKLIQEVGYDS